MEKFYSVWKKFRTTVQLKESHKNKLTQLKEDHKVLNEVSREACPRAGLTTGYRAAPRRGPAVPRLPGRFRYGRR